MCREAIIIVLLLITGCQVTHVQKREVTGNLSIDHELETNKTRASAKLTFKL